MCRSALVVPPCDFISREMALGSCLVVCAPAFALSRSRVRFPPGPRQLRLKQRSRSMWSVLLSILRTDRSAQRLAERNLHRATCTEQLEDRCRATCVQQLAESNLRTAAWNNASRRTMRWSSSEFLVWKRRIEQRPDPIDFGFYQHMAFLYPRPGTTKKNQHAESQMAPALQLKM